MVSPLTSGLQQQIPAANTFQPGGSAEDVRQREDREQTRPAGTQAAQTQASETRNNGRQEETVRASSRDEDNGQVRANSTRGSVLDLSV